MRRKPGVVVSAAFLTLSLVVSGVIPALSQVPSNVTVVAQQGRYHVQISAPASLDMVLNEFCRQTSTRCRGTFWSRSLIVASIGISGTWREILNQLLEGSDLNYAMNRPDPEASKELVIYGPSGAPSTSAPSPQASTPSQMPPPGHPGARQGGPVQAQYPPPPADPDQAAAPADPSSNATSAQSNSDPVAAFASSVGSTGLASPLQFLPFPDSQGNPVPLTGDSNPTYSPFLDGHGRLIPVGHSPLQFLPFPDPNGNPIPAR